MEDTYFGLVVAPGKGVEGLYDPHPARCTCDECTAFHEARVESYSAFGLTP